MLFRSCRLNLSRAFFESPCSVRSALISCRAINIPKCLVYMSSISLINDSTLSPFEKACLPRYCSVHISMQCVLVVFSYFFNAFRNPVMFMICRQRSQSRPDWSMTHSVILDPLQMSIKLLTCATQLLLVFGVSLWRVGFMIFIRNHRFPHRV